MARPRFCRHRHHVAESGIVNGLCSAAASRPVQSKQLPICIKLTKKQFEIHGPFVADPNPWESCRPLFPATCLLDPSWPHFECRGIRLRLLGTKDPDRAVVDTPTDLDSSLG
ncbi:unnamed protein product [Bursaphelenchus xylophilus]|uniref:(pine wood nematode) hypothetical protein n=1 Tax=Bursaphelenchus xylophilus TaxID=6326 RepID=A0A1I7RH71_BURXY|nr:unnamed protein product [Bursaphelenchus xylophilus]CAG9115953.1 unnamed protein product [Bursaphelenchus xylophilus]